MVRVNTVLTILTYFISLLGVAPVFPHLDMVARTVLVASFTFGCLCDRRDRHYLRGIFPTIISIGFFLFYAARFSGDNLLMPVLNLLAILLSVRLLSEKTERNGMQIVALSLFALAGSSLLNLSMSFLLYLAFFLIAIAVFLVFLTFHTFGNRQTVSSRELKKILAVALVMPALSFPLMAAFFVIIPRTQYPLWNFLNTPVQKVTGFSERVEPGSSANMNEVKKVVFRVESPRLSDRELYWRGIVLNSIDGQAWVRSEKQPVEKTRIGKGKLVRQTFYPEPSMSRYLITLNVPMEIRGTKTDMSADSVFVRGDSRRKRIKYDAVSVVTDGMVMNGRIDRDFYLQTPSRMSARIISLAEGIAAKGRSDEERLSLLADYFKSGKFSYTTRDLPQSSHPMDEFLFSKKSGNCEFFAGSFAVLLRAMGIPSRLVGGYHGGEYNEMGGYYVVTEDRAHVWVEAFIQGKGWLMIDPTMFSADFAQVEKRLGRGALTRIQLLIDSLGYYWNQAVVGYDLEKQLQVLRKTNEVFQGTRFNFGSRKLLLFIFPVFLFTLTLIFRKKYRHITREEKVVKKLLKRVRKKYPAVLIEPGTGITDLAKMVNEPAVHQFAELYCSVVYRDRRLSDDEYRELSRLAARA